MQKKIYRIGVDLMILRVAALGGVTILFEQEMN